MFWRWSKPWRWVVVLEAYASFRRLVFSPFCHARPELARTNRCIATVSRVDLVLTLRWFALLGSKDWGCFGKSRKKNIISVLLPSYFAIKNVRFSYFWNQSVTSEGREPSNSTLHVCLKIADFCTKFYDFKFHGDIYWNCWTGPCTVNFLCLMIIVLWNRHSSEKMYSIFVAILFAVTIVENMAYFLETGRDVPVQSCFPFWHFFCSLVLTVHSLASWLYCAALLRPRGNLRKQFIHIENISTACLMFRTTKTAGPATRRRSKTSCERLPSSRKPSSFLAASPAWSRHSGCSITKSLQ